jgi:beta-1,4-mannosyltransferase
MTTVWYLPEHATVKNPYGQLLQQSLVARGIRVLPQLYKHLFALDALSGRPDVVHFQFVQPYILPAENEQSWSRATIKGVVFLVQVLVLRMIGARIVWTVHDLADHEQRLLRIEWFFTLLFTRVAHRIVVHGHVARSAVIHRYRLARQSHKLAVIFHPNYIGAYPDVLTKAQAREVLGIAHDALVILCIGQIRPYKGLPDLVDAFRALRAARAPELWIAGEPVDAALTEELQRAASDNAAIHLRAVFHSPTEIGMLLNACDIVALPYRAILTSGAALLAMSFGKPCIAPRLGCLVEALDNEGAFLYEPSDPDALHHALERSLASVHHWPAMGAHNFERASAWSWSRAAELLDDVYHDSPRRSVDGDSRKAAGAHG